ncbi:hypothetical protein FGE12_05420 [Aggregicoccus sp. 17bor-14]|uniref:hypothetical protein n=1 Tax=Myxococcaceae TaxID=31 RepID=UPI00129C5174|nr:MULTISPECIES: hypothetical protein [Myxococcaceae]MBF5041821.1 hypothetical protein [Simulacricoccus sp. 17bor-14]MRI87602.1 hypothetical protein [Aggregicoccus sp. 17bor-14]
MALSSKTLRRQLGSSRLTVPLLMPVCFWGLGAPRPRTLRALLLSPLLLGLGALGVLGWRAAQARAVAPAAPGPDAAPRRAARGFRFTWQMGSDVDELSASAASGH